MTSDGWIISHRCSWITVYVLYCNAQVNLIVILMTCTCIACIVYYINCSTVICLPSMLFIFMERHLLWTVDPGPFFYILITIYFLQALFTFLQTNIFYHTIRLILCLQQTGEIDNLTASWGKVFWLCCVQVPRCCWRRSYTPDSKQILWSSRQSKLASTFRSDFFLLLVN
jgi:hypothetical protein